MYIKETHHIYVEETHHIYLPTKPTIYMPRKPIIYVPRKPIIYMSRKPIKYLLHTDQKIQVTDQISTGHRLNIYRTPIKNFQDTYQISPGTHHVRQGNKSYICQGNPSYICQLNPSFICQGNPQKSPGHRSNISRTSIKYLQVTHHICQGNPSYIWQGNPSNISWTPIRYQQDNDQISKEHL